MAVIEKIITSGNRDPSAPPIHENNVYLVGDEEEVIVIDPAHDPEAIFEKVGGRTVKTILLTHGHWDHSRAAPSFAEQVSAPIYLGSADQFLWQEATGKEAGFCPLEDGMTFEVAGIELLALATPGHTPGSTSILVESLNAVLTGDTLFPGGPGATRWSYSSFDQIIASIEQSLFVLPDETVLYPGHGADSTIGAERPQLPEWVARGW